jgi:hypothetical protein
MYKKITTVIILFVAIVFVAPHQAEAAWYNDIWNWITDTPPSIGVSGLQTEANNETQSLGVSDNTGYWVYIRTEDRPGVTQNDDAGRSKKGDIVTIMPDSPLRKPTEKEKQEYLIIKVNDITKEDIDNYTESWQADPQINKPEGETQIIAYRKNKIDIDGLNLPIKKGIYNKKIDKQTVRGKISMKNSRDLAGYEVNRLAYRLFERPLDKLAGMIIPRAYAAGTIVSTVNKLGGDYNTLTLWEDAQDGDLVTATEIHQADCYKELGDLVDQVIVDGSTTNSSYYMYITSPVGERHTGKAGTGFHIKKTSAIANASGIVKIMDIYTRVEWLEISDFYANFSGITAGVYVDPSMTPTIRNNIIHDGVGGGQTPVSSGIVFGRNAYIYDNIIYNVRARGIYQNDLYGTASVIENNTVYNYNMAGGTYRGITNLGTNATGKSQNNIVVAGAGGGDCYFYDGDQTNGHNASSDDTASSTGDIITASTDDFVSVAAGSEDLRLVSTAVEIGLGTDLATTPSGVEVDINGYNRDTNGVTWDMGAHQYVAAAPSAAVSTPHTIFINKTKAIIRGKVIIQ